MQTMDVQNRTSWQEILDALAAWDRVETATLSRLKGTSFYTEMCSRKNNQLHTPGQTMELEGSDDFSAEILRTGKRLDVENADSHPQWKRNEFVRQGLETCSGIPVFDTEGRIFGALCIYGRSSFQDERLTVHLLPQCARMLEADLRSLHFEKKYYNMLQQKESLVKEYHHRIKNNMSTVFGFLYLQAESVQDETTRQTLDDAAMRVKSMAVLYDKLYRSDTHDTLSLQDYLSTLIEDILATYHNNTAIRTNIEIADIGLDAKILSSIGIIINELITNSIKHAFNGREEGEITILVSCRDHHVHIVYYDDGKGISSKQMDQAKTTFGIQLIHLLVGQMDGELKMDGTNGTRFEINFTTAVEE